MNIKKFIPVFFCLCLIISCKNQGKDRFEEPDAEFPPTAREIPRTDDASKDVDKDRDARSIPSETKTETNMEGEGTNSPSSAVNGNYIKVGEESDNNCSCHCINIDFTTNGNLCLQEDSLYITVRYENSQDNSIKVYFVAASNKDTDKNDIPWADFDKNSAIATITSKTNGELELDWLGFTINGDIAMDYAILGKKSLEGSYKKK